MALLVPNEGEKQILDVVLGSSSGATENLSLKLFKNDVTPGETDTAATYTEVDDTTYPGYAAITLTRGAGWTTTAGAGAGGAAQAAYAEQTFTFTAGTGGPVYGYFVVGATSAKCYWAERFASVANVPAAGGTIKITPKFELA